MKRIVVGSFYVSPNSPHKAAIIEHIIETIHVLRSKFDNQVNFLLGGDFNRLNIGNILDAYWALNQLVSVPTRQGATLEIVLSNLHSLYYPPITLPPLEEDLCQSLSLEISKNSFNLKIGLNCSKQTMWMKRYTYFTRES